MGRTRQFGPVCCALLIALSVGCSDDDETDGMSPGAQGGTTASDASPVPDGGPIRDAMAIPVVDAEPPECIGNQRRCVPDRPSERDLCVSNQWAREYCPVGFLCVEGECAMPEEGGCIDGERGCDDTGAPTVCADGEWQASEACEGETLCVDGRCLTPACAQASARRSYIGCEYLAVDLPNTAFATTDFNGDGNAPDSTTQDAPVAIVVTNPWPDDSAYLTLRDAGGALTTTRGMQVVAVPAIDGLPANTYQSQIVESSVRNAMGAVVENRIAQVNNLEVPPLGIATLLLPRRMGPVVNSSIQPSAFRLSADRPVVAYQFSPYCCNFSFSNDASLLLPVSSLGTGYRYIGAPHHFVVREGNALNTPAVMAVVAPNDGTAVSVRIPRRAAVAPETEGRIRVDENVLEFTLNGQDVALLSTGTSAGRAIDLSGAEIRSNQPIAVFSSHACTFYPENVMACDHLQEQLTPVDTWGRQFQLVPPADRGNNYPDEITYWKLVADYEVTQVQLSVPFNQLGVAPPGFRSVTYCGDLLVAGENADSFVLTAGQTCEFGTRQPVAITASRPILVTGTISGQHATAPPGTAPFGQRAGDPAFFMVPPQNQLRNDYTFLTPDTYFQDYVTVIATEGNPIQLDGVELNMADAQPVLGSQFRFKHVEIGDGPHFIEGAQPFGILVYAYDDFVSYAYTGGLNLTKAPRRE